MRMTSPSRLVCWMALPATALIGCAPDGSGESPGRAPASQSATRPAAEPPAARTANPRVGVSAGGVTTSMSAPAESTEEQYAKACVAAKEWMSARGGDPQNLVEPFLDEVQTTGSVTPATFGTGWSDLTDPQRSAVIIAVRAAADGGC